MRCRDHEECNPSALSTRCKKEEETRWGVAILAGSEANLPAGEALLTLPVSVTRAKPLNLPMPQCPH